MSCKLAFFLCFTTYRLCLLSQNPPVTPFVALLSDGHQLASNLIARGPRPLNVVQFVTSAVDLEVFADEVRAGINAADALARPNYKPFLYDALLG